MCDVCRLIINIPDGDLSKSKVRCAIWGLYTMSA